MNKRFLKMTALLLALLMCFQLLAACENTEDDDPTEETLDPATRLQQELTGEYLDALAVWAEKDAELEVEYARKVTVNGQTYFESGTVDQRYWNQGTEDFLALVTQDITFGDDAYETEIKDIYSDGKFYETVVEDQFYGEMTAEEFLERQTPLQLLDPALYTLSRTESGIAFADATAVESWLAPEEAKLLSASAQVELDEDGALDEMEYTVSYQYGAALMELEYEVSLSNPGKKPDVPESTDGYVLVDDMMAVYALEHAFGYLSQVRHLTTNSSKLILSAAAGVSLQENIQIDTYAVEDQFAMLWDTGIRVMDYTTDQEESYESIEKFIDGKYTISEDGGEETAYDFMSQKLVEESVVHHALSLFPHNAGIATTESNHLGNVLFFSYTGSEMMGEEYCQIVSERLFQDKEFLNDYASAYETKEMCFYLGLDAYSMLPTAIGVQYEGVHTIEGYEYVLTMQADQSFDLASMDSYKEIFDEPEPDKEPASKATPLLYKVTGPEGQQMYLFGTIHVGDDRTAYLPQEFYDAFQSADALAVECDVDTFDQMMEDDSNEELIDQVAEYYFYSDGTTTKDHIVTEDLYEDALMKMKAIGAYNYNTEYLKVGLWGESLDGYSMQQGYTLNSDKGMEYRLLPLAEAQNKPLLEMESVLFQIKMTSDYSDELQEVQLFSGMYTDPLDYAEHLMEMYEKWCAGDEQALIEMINEEESWKFTEEDFDLTELTGEELERAEAVLKDLDNINAQLEKLQAEYNKAMSSDRNKGMIEVAKGYLESDQTVFVAVGLAHLLAQDGLVNGLRQAGYTVELVKYS